MEWKLQVKEKFNWFFLLLLFFSVSNENIESSSIFFPNYKNKQINK